jgi:hypothetical protein
MVSSFSALYNAKKAGILGPGHNVADAVTSGRGLDMTGEANDALMRDLPKVDNSEADKRLIQDTSLRSGQNRLHNLWTDYSQGKGPNIAQRQADIKMGDLIEQQAGAQQPGLSSLAAARQGAGMGASIASNAATNRGKEQALSLGQMGQTTQQMGAADVNIMGLGANRARDVEAIKLAGKQQNLKMYLSKLGLGQNYDKLAQEGRLSDIFASLGLEDSYKSARDSILGTMTDSKAQFDEHMGNIYKQSGNLLTMGAAGASGMLDDPEPKYSATPDYNAWKKEAGYDPRYGF